MTPVARETSTLTPANNSALPAEAAPTWRRAWWRTAPLTILVVVLGKAVSILLSGFGLGESWYDSLRLPITIPLRWIFPFAWPVVCIILGSAWAMILSVPPSRLRWWALMFFYIGLALNFLWMPIFFMGRDIVLAKYILSAMVVALVPSLILFLRIRRVAGLLLIPYLLWVSFVTALIVGIERLNPAAGESITQLTEDKINAVREKDRERLLKDLEWSGRDDRRDGPRSRRDDAREDPRVDRRERRNQP